MKSDLDLLGEMVSVLTLIHEGSGAEAGDLLRTLTHAELVYYAWFVSAYMLSVVEQSSTLLGIDPGDQVAAFIRRSGSQVVKARLEDEA